MIMNNFLVCVWCKTYNHAPYIVDAMNGFTMQQTAFPFVCTIVDDASTDGEQEIIKMYLDKHFDMSDNSVVRKEETEDYQMFFSRHIENRNCFFAVYFLKYNHYIIRKSKLPYFDEWGRSVTYEALCEGDDYWIDPLKLTKQVSFMDSHPHHSLCIHAFRHDTLTDVGIKTEMVHKYTNDKEIIPDADVLNIHGRFGATASMFYRKEARDNYPEWASKAPIGDRPFKMVLFLRGHIGYIDDIMSVYREGTVSSWTVKMRNNLEYKIRNSKGRLQLAKAFDKFTNRKYHQIMKDEIWIIRYELIKLYLRRIKSMSFK